MRWHSGQAVRPTPTRSQSASPRPARWRRRPPARPRRPARRPAVRLDGVPRTGVLGRSPPGPAVGSGEPDGVRVHDRVCAPRHIGSIPPTGESGRVRSAAARPERRPRRASAGVTVGGGTDAGGGRLMEPISLLVGGVLLAAGFCRGRLSRRHAPAPPPMTPLCGCGHALSQHDRETSHLLRRTAPRHLRPARSLGRPQLGALHLPAVRRPAADRRGVRSPAAAAADRLMPWPSDARTGR